MGIIARKQGSNRAEDNHENYLQMGANKRRKLIDQGFIAVNIARIKHVIQRQNIRPRKS